MEVIPRVIRIFCLPDGRQPFTEWLRDLKDDRAAARIKARLARVRLGNFGDDRSIGAGVQELRVDYGPGYRIYFAQTGRDIVILLCGGDKGEQREDIKTTKKYWAAYKKASHHDDR